MRIFMLGIDVINVSRYWYFDFTSWAIIREEREHNTIRPGFAASRPPTERHVEAVDTILRAFFRSYSTRHDATV